MRNTDVKPYAKQLMSMSLGTDGQVDRQRVGAILESLRKIPAYRRKPILKQYCTYIQKELNQCQAVLEYAGELSQAAIDSMMSLLHEDSNKTHITTISVENPKLIAGIRVRLGDNVYENSLNTRLASLQKAF